MNNYLNNTMQYKHTHNVPERGFFQDESNYKVFLVLNRQDGNSFQNVSPFFIYKSLNNLVKNLKTVKKLKNGTILIEATNEEQTNTLLKCSMLGNSIPVKVSLHDKLNTSKGVIYSKELNLLEESEILQELKEQKVIKVERIWKKIPDKTDLSKKVKVKTHLYIVTFNKTFIPYVIKAGYEKVFLLKNSFITLHSVQSALNWAIPNLFVGPKIHFALSVGK